MQLIYINKGTSPSLFAEYLKKYNNVIPQQAQKYNQLLMEGFVSNGEKVVSISTRPLNRAMTTQKYFPSKKEMENGIDYYYVPFFNIKLLRELSVFFGVFFKVLLKKAHKNDVVICDALNISATAAALCASLLRGFETVGIVTDVPCHRPYGKVPYNEKINLWLMKRFKKYLFLTEQMSKIVNPKNRPYVVLEGHSDISMKDTVNELSNKYDKKVCLYAGSLKRIYGIENLVEGFVKANVENSELYIYGNGDYVEDLKKLSEKYENVKYMGIAPNSVIVEEELKATLLVNPRPTNEEYTKYSFPSKNMEYMASGTPLLTTKLPGMPTEYNEYVYLLEQENIEGIKNALTEILGKSKEELHSKGEAAKNFVMNEKNNIVQAKKVIDMIKRR
ncbi:MAG: glycosyltransferase [Acutalibacteraceae bacterium]|nr:glycosyltransferase [Acutalibacteraceae bacterium]